MRTLLQYSSGRESSGSYDLNAHKCFWLAILGPVMILLVTLFGCAVAMVTSWILGLLLPRTMALATGMVIAAVFSFCIPVAGFAHGLIAVHRARYRPASNRWQAIIGLALHSMLLAAIAVMLYRALR